MSALGPFNLQGRRLSAGTLLCCLLIHAEEDSDQAMSLGLKVLLGYLWVISNDQVSNELHNPLAVMLKELHALLGGENWNRRRDNLCDLLFAAFRGCSLRRGSLSYGFLRKDLLLFSCHIIPVEALVEGMVSRTYDNLKG